MPLAITRKKNQAIVLINSEKEVVATIMISPKTRGLFSVLAIETGFTVHRKEVYDALVKLGKDPRERGSVSQVLNDK